MIGLSLSAMERQRHRADGEQGVRNGNWILKGSSSMNKRSQGVHAYFFSRKAFSSCIFTAAFVVFANGLRSADKGFDPSCKLDHGNA